MSSSKELRSEPEKKSTRECCHNILSDVLRKTNHVVLGVHYQGGPGHLNEQISNFLEVDDFRMHRSLNEPLANFAVGQMDYSLVTTL